MLTMQIQIQIAKNQVERNDMTGHHCQNVNSQLIWLANFVWMSFLNTTSNAKTKNYQILQKNLDILEAS